MKAWLRKWWVLMLLAAGCAALLSTWGSKSARSFQFGPPLPEGRARPQLVSRDDVVVLLAPDGSLWTWGGMQNRLQGILPSPTRSTVPLRVGAESDWLRVAASMTSTLALKTNGTIWGWGYSMEGELLTLGARTRFPPMQLGTDTDWNDVQMGSGHVLALKRDGSLWAWGRNRYGALGDGGASTNVTVPTRIMKEATWRAVAAAGFNSYGIQADGSLWGWGFDLTGGKTNLVVPTLLDAGTNWLAMSAGMFELLALKADGTLWTCGQNIGVFVSRAASRSAISMVQIGSDADWREVFAGRDYFIARKADGTWWGCGGNEHGQVGLGLASRSPVASPARLPLRFDPWAMTAGTHDITALLGRDGTVWSWGIRAGEPSGRLWSDQVRERWERFLRGGAGGIVTYTSVYAHDTQPHFVWELPTSVKSALGTNAPSQPKPAP